MTFLKNAPFFAIFDQFPARLFLLTSTSPQGFKFQVPGKTIAHACVSSTFNF